MLAHELRNPMVPITINLEVLKRVAPGTPPARQALDVIRRQTRLLARLVDDLLDLSRGSQHKLRLQREPLDIVQLVRACAVDHAPVLADRSIRSDLDLPDRPLLVHGDRVRLVQVIDNLVSNAIKFTNPGGYVRLRLHEDLSRKLAVLHVVDSGRGWTRLLSRIFEPFRQGASSLERPDAGLGLGLALVKMLVSLHDGTVEARSEGPGRGSEFIVRLPLGVPCMRLLPAPRPAATSTEASIRSRWRVLVVDDYIDAAKGLQTLLELDGHIVEVAHDGAGALAKARAFRPQVMFCDIFLLPWLSKCSAATARGLKCVPPGCKSQRMRSAASRRVLIDASSSR